MSPHGDDMRAGYLSLLLNGCLGAPYVSSPGGPAAARAGNLSGVHLLITTIHSAQGMNMGYDMDTNHLVPSEDWNGFFADVIEWVAHRAGFTYELFSPSGDGQACVQAEGKPFAPKTFATQYNCGADDIYTLNRTHVYWAGYYISPSRLSRNLFTVPVISDVGLGLVLAKPSPDPWAVALTLFLVFEPTTWLLIICSFTVFTLAMWLVDHGGSHESRRDVLANAIPELFGRRKGTSGYLSFENTTEYITMSYQTLIGDPAIFTPRTNAGWVLNLIYATFTMIVISAYTAELTAELSAEKLSFPVDRLEDVEQAQLEERMGPMCVVASTAYASWLAAAFPAMKLLHVPGSTDEMVAALRAGECEGIVDVWPATEAVARNLKHCSAGLNVIGSPLNFGPQDFSVGVRADLTDVQMALSYWIQQLRTCNPKQRGSVCYEKHNMASLYRSWFLAATCSDEGVRASGIKPDFFYVVCIILFGASVIMVAVELTRPHLHDAVLARWLGHGLVEYIETAHAECVVNSCVDAEEICHVMRESARISSVSGARATKENAHTCLLRHLKRYYVRTDMSAWHLLKATTTQLASEKALLQAGAVAATFRRHQPLKIAFDHWQLMRRTGQLDETVSTSKVAQPVQSDWSPELQALQVSSVPASDATPLEASTVPASDAPPFQKATRRVKAEAVLRAALEAAHAEEAETARHADAHTLRKAADGSAAAEAQAEAALQSAPEVAEREKAEAIARAVEVPVSVAPPLQASAVPTPGAPRTLQADSASRWLESTRGTEAPRATLEGGKRALKVRRLTELIEAQVALLARALDEIDFAEQEKQVQAFVADPTEFRGLATIRACQRKHRGKVDRAANKTSALAGYAVNQMVDQACDTFTQSADSAMQGRGFNKEAEYSGQVKGALSLSRRPSQNTPSGWA